MGVRCEVVVDGPVARSVVEIIAARFGPSTLDRDASVLSVEDVDHATIRALMVLLWDTGHEVLAMSVSPQSPPGESHDSTR